MSEAEFKRASDRGMTFTISELSDFILEIT